jgi:membrane protease YdiL (CAAX protease family)
MTPHDPLPAEFIPSVPPPIEEQRRSPFWDYQDLFVFLFLSLPCVFVAGFIVRSVSLITHLNVPFQELLVQLVWYLLVFSVLYALLRLRYRQPFWRSLGFVPPFRDAHIAFTAGPFVAIAIAYLGYVIHPPTIQQPFQQMLADRPTIILFSIFAVAIGPLCEELAFRGFLMPLLVRSVGAAPGIVLTGFLFGSLHAPEYGWSWKHVALIATAGSIFGWVRYRTGSTASSTLMHSSYNLTQLIGFLIFSGHHD